MNGEERVTKRNRMKGSPGSLSSVPSNIRQLCNTFFVPKGVQEYLYQPLPHIRTTWHPRKLRFTTTRERLHYATVIERQRDIKTLPGEVAQIRQELVVVCMQREGLQAKSISQEQQLIMLQLNKKGTRDSVND